MPLTLEFREKLAEFYSVYPNYGEDGPFQPHKMRLIRDGGGTIATEEVLYPNLQTNPRNFIDIDSTVEFDVPANETILGVEVWTADENTMISSKNSNKSPSDREYGEPGGLYRVTKYEIEW